VRRLFLLAFIWGWSFLFIKVILEDAPPTFLAWGRIALGLAVLAVALVRRREGLPERRYWGHLLVLGLTMSVLPFMLIGWGEEHISSALASVLNACTPLFAAGFAAGLLGERLRPPQLAGIAIGFLGVAVVAGVGGGDLAGSSLLGSVAVVVAGAGYGFGFAYANRFTTGLSALQLSFGQLLAGTLLLAPVAAVDVAAGSISAPGPPSAWSCSAPSAPATPTCSTTAPSRRAAPPSPPWSPISSPWSRSPPACSCWASRSPSAWSSAA
jgi:drug/metabolite transporter (DMT)-like permease